MSEAGSENARGREVPNAPHLRPVRQVAAHPRVSRSRLVTLHSLMVSSSWLMPPTETAAPSFSRLAARAPSYLAAGMTGSMTHASCLPPVCSVTSPSKTAGGRSRASLCRNGPTPVNSFFMFESLPPVPPG